MEVETFTPLLEMVGTVTVPATTESFVVNERFVLGGNSPKILWLGNSFDWWFYNKTEEQPMEEAKLLYARLTKPSTDASILAELGENAETTLAQVWQLLKLQPNDKEGVMLTNRWSNIFYVRDADSTLRALRIGWDDYGWLVNADMVKHPDMRGDGNRVFSRSS